jgi:hypothetical protein
MIPLCKEGKNKVYLDDSSHTQIVADFTQIGPSIGIIH